ncbi:MAG: tRNA pseudouridine(55) synthase TruB [Anaerolineae bacterium]|nr:MAG: tRNA pseudouridine(55) synthase TruB [Anaerolineae bacterium]
MAPANPDLPLFGLLNIHKPSGPTSHDVVNAVRRGTGERRVGHSGTLDPLAEGVLVLALGKATRLLEYLAGSDKRYRAEVRLGITTDTYDIQGEVVAEHPAPGDLRPDTVRDVLQSQFSGDILQRPPVYSALKVGGKAAYARARAGEEVALQSRPVTIHAVDLLRLDSPDLTLDVHCGPGTYVRSLAHDLGQALGPGATLTGLTRLASGDFRLEEAVSLDALQAAFEGGTWPQHLLPADLALARTPQVRLDEIGYEHLRNGRPIPAQAVNAGLARAYAPDGRFVAVLVGDTEGGAWRPKKVFV